MEGSIEICVARLERLLATEEQLYNKAALATVQILYMSLLIIQLHPNQFVYICVVQHDK